MAPVKVFGSAAFTNVARVLVCLEEVGAEYEVVDIDFPAKEHKGPDHLARNVSTYMGSAIWTGSGVPGRRLDTLPVPCNFKVRAPQVQDRQSQPIKGRQSPRISARGRLAGRRGAPVRPRHELGVRPAPRRPGARRDPGPEDHRGEHREAEEGAGRVRGPADQAQVPRGGFRQPRGSQPLPRDALLHGDALRVGV